MKEFGGTEVLKRTGVSKTQLNYWIRSGAVVPKKNAHGSGLRRIFNHRNIMEVRVCKELAKFGILPAVMKIALDMLRGDDCVELPEKTLSYWDFIRESPHTMVTMIIKISDGKVMPYLIQYTGTFCIVGVTYGEAMVAIDLYGMEAGT